MSAILDTVWFRDPLRRRLTFVVVALLLAALSLWPRHYLARAQLAPQESSGGLSEVLAQAGSLVSLNTLVGNHRSIEDDLVVGRSHVVLRSVIDKLGRARAGDRDPTADEINLRHKVDVSAIRGSILQVEVRDTDPIRALKIANAYASAIRDRLTNLALQQAAQKREIAENRMRDASARLANAQQAVTRFRTQNKLAAPELQLGAAVSLLASLQGRLDAREAQLKSLQQFATPNNIELKGVQAEVQSLRAQVAQSQDARNSQGGPSLQGITSVDSGYLNLYREQKFAETLYEVYSRYLEEVTIDELTADVNMTLIEPPYIEPSRQFNVLASSGFVLMVLLLIATEFYIVRPPVGAR